MFKEIGAQLRPVLVSMLVLTLLTGFIYPALVTAIAQVFFAKQANGSLILEQGKPVGSELIGQPFSDPAHFWSRPSGTSPAPYKADASCGSNQAPSNPDFKTAVGDRITALQDANKHEDDGTPVPVDLVTASGSGLDPHISPAAAHYQEVRIVRETGIPFEKIRALIAEHTEGRQLSFLGEPSVNVLKLNLALDKLRATQK